MDRADFYFIYFHRCWWLHAHHRSSLLWHIIKNRAIYVLSIPGISFVRSFSCFFFWRFNGWVRGTLLFYLPPPCARSLWLYCSDQSGHKCKMFLSLTSIFRLFFSCSVVPPFCWSILFDFPTKKESEEICWGIPGMKNGNGMSRMIVPWGMMKRTLTWDHSFLLVTTIRFGGGGRCYSMLKTIAKIRPSQRKWNNKERVGEKVNVKWYLGDRIEIEAVHKCW